MDFLNRRRSLALTSPEPPAAPSDSPPTVLDKPLPTLPHLTTTKLGAIEHIPSHRTSSGHSSTAGELIRRVSSMFSSRKKRPPALQLAKGSMSRIYESPNASPRSMTDSLDDIRRPSGLGSAASLSNRSLPPSPFVSTYDRDSVFSPPGHNGYIRTRSTSSPNLLRSLSLISRGSKNMGRDRGGAVPLSRQSSRTQPPPSTTILCIPVETMSIVLSHLSKSDVALVARTCRLFLSATLTVLYGNVDLQDFTPQQLEKFIALLASRRDLTDLVRTFSCHTWPLFFLTASSSLLSPSSSSSLSTSPKQQRQYHDPDTQHRHTLLTATFTLAFQRMSNLTSLTLPAYDHDLLAHHTAFGLRSITFTCSTLSIEGSNELFAWLDGQTNITTLLFPHLFQDGNYGKDGTSSTLRPIITTTPRPVSSSGLPSPNKKYLVAPYLVPFPSATSPTSSKASARPKSASPSSPSYNTTTFASSPSSSPLPSPHSTSQASFPVPSPSLSPSNIPSVNTPYTYPHYQTSPLSSPTLLPNLTTLRGPPSLIIALTTDDPSSRRRPRPLKNVTVNINSTIYSGLRPTMIMNQLVGTTRRLGLWFGEGVDRRTVEKVLGAAGSALGGSPDAREQQDGRFASGFRFGDGEWRGLVELNVVFVSSLPAAPGSDEALHKMMSTAIPRYPLLRALRLSYHPSPQTASSPLTLSPGTPTSTRTIPTPNTPGSRLSGIYKKGLSPPEQAYVRQWTKHCTDLGRVVFLSESEWYRK